VVLLLLALSVFHIGRILVGVANERKEGVGVVVLLVELVGSASVVVRVVMDKLVLVAMVSDRSVRSIFIVGWVSMSEEVSIMVSNFTIETKYEVAVHSRGHAFNE
jgi:hypothetical protein